MKVLKHLAVVSVLATSALAQQEHGLFINAGGGYAKVSAASFTQTTSYGEVLRSTDENDSVGFGHLEVGFRFNSNWDLALGYADYASAEVNVSFPKYSGFFSILPFPDYSRNVLVYDSHQFEIIPSYSYLFAEKWRLRARAGATYRETNSHFETTYYAWFSGRPNGTFSETFPEEKKGHWSYLLSLGLEYTLTPGFTIGASVSYAPFKMKLPVEGIAGLGNGWTTPSTAEADVESVEAAFTFTWRL